MSPCRKLKRLQKTACKRLQYLRLLAISSSRNTSYRQRNIGISFVVIELLSTWTNFSRTFYLSCRMGTSFGNGSSVTCSTVFTDLNHAIEDAILLLYSNRVARPSAVWHRREEPTWHDKSVILKLAQLQNWSNLLDVQAALSTGTQALDDLPIFRNYFAHRNQGTMQAAQNAAIHYLISTALLPANILLERPYGRSNPLLIEWINDIETIVEFLCDPL